MTAMTSSFSIHMVKNVLWWIALARRYQTSPGPGYDGRVHVSQVLQPVTIVDHLLDRPRALNKNITASANQEEVVFAVPPGKQWTLYHYDVRANATGTYNYQPKINDLAAFGNTVLLSAPVAATSAAFYDPPAGFPMAAGWEFALSISGFVGAGTVSTVEVLVLEREWVDDRQALPAA